MSHDCLNRMCMRLLFGGVLCVLSVAQSEALKSHVYLCFVYTPCSSVRFCFLYLEELLLVHKHLGLLCLLSGLMLLSTLFVPGYFLCSKFYFMEYEYSSFTFLFLQINAWNVYIFLHSFTVCRKFLDDSLSLGYS